ncbi:hypothetical protein ColLi_13227 [Colletotrichum liriopes]|uniref:C6 zinc finger domain-containing protein n=1 Tax=Colletotrichum liriopes TaxID=708192 RepID=A0AA37GZT8_9PEZI|nr:hypothetical protein ColLi_13227 [Colletotrichum liriopes]
MNIPDCNHTSSPGEDSAALSPAPNDPQGLSLVTEPVRPDPGDQEYAAGRPIESRQHALLYDEGECETSPGYERFQPRPDYQIPVPAPIAPSGLLESAKFAEDILYYHHLRDSSPYGLLSTLSLNDIFQAEHLDGAFFHAALALSALSISVSNAPEPLVAKASLHALDHFVTALGSIRSAHLDDSDDQSAQAETFVLPQGRYMAISWLATIIFLAYFELQRGQLKLWYIHCRAALAFLSQNLSSVRASAAGESLTRSFARIASLLEIYDRTYSDISRIASTDVSESLMLSLANSPYHADRLLCILPRVIELEEKWRGNPQHDTLWRQQAEHLVDELEAWRENLPAAEAPLAQDEDKGKSFGIAEGPGFSVTPLTLVDARDPVKAATSFMHYLVSLLRLQTFYSPSSDRKSPPNAAATVHLICRLAAGVSFTSCTTVNAYGHGMLPAMMNAYYMTDSAGCKEWIRGWIGRFPREREGIWNVRHAERLLTYVDEEYGRKGLRSGWRIIKVRMVDLDEEATPQGDEEEKQGDRLAVEIYSRNRMGWSVDYVDIP